MSFIDYLIQNYIWLVAVLVIIIITVIGYIADRRNMKRKEKAVKKEEQEVIKDTSNSDTLVSNMDIPSGEVQNWDQLDPNINMNSQMNTANDFNMYPNENVNMNSQAMFPDPVMSPSSISTPLEEPHVSMENKAFDIPNPVSEPISNPDFSNMNYGFHSDISNNNPVPIMPEENVPPVSNPSNMVHSSVIEPVPIIVPTPSTLEEPSYTAPMDMDTPAPISSSPVSDPVYENEWDNVQTMEIPNISVPSSENSNSSLDDTDMWKL